MNIDNPIVFGLAVLGGVVALFVILKLTDRK